MKRAAIWVAGLAGVYLVVLVVLGFALEGCVEERVQRRLAESMDAEVTIDDVSVSVLRGTITIDGIAIHRERGGLVEIDVAEVEADMPAGGLMLIDRDPQRLLIRGVEMKMSAMGALAVRRPDHEPLHVGAIEIRDARMTLMPTALLPELGKIDLDVAVARTGPCTLNSGVSWIFALAELDARVAAPGDVAVAVGYRSETLSVGAGLFGADPIEVEFPLPEPDPSKLEVAQLADLGTALAKKLVTEGAKNWFKRNVVDKVEDLTD